MPIDWSKIKPWQCAECGEKNISANKEACPKCGEPRPGSDAAKAQEATGQTMRTYEGEREMQEGIAQMAAHGWIVASQSAFQPRSGVGRTIGLGVVGAALIKPKAKFIVTFKRADATS